MTLQKKKTTKKEKEEGEVKKEKKALRHRPACSGPVHAGECLHGRVSASAVKAADRLAIYCKINCDDHACRG